MPFWACPFPLPGVEDNDAKTTSKTNDIQTISAPSRKPESNKANHMYLLNGCIRQGNEDTAIGIGGPDTMDTGELILPFQVMPCAQQGTEA